MSSHAAASLEPLRTFDPTVVTNGDRRRRLLVVDDDDGPRQALRIIFKDHYEVLAAESGMQALELLRENEVHAAVVDIKMPGMTGIEVLDRLKGHDAAIEVIMLTAHETLDTARQALRLGACEYLTKPFELKVMREAVARAMERRSFSEEIALNNQKLFELQAEIQNQKLKEEIARARGEIYASIVHDINGPLTIISGFIEAISQRIGSSTKIEGENLMVIRDRLTRITRQVNNCIDISRRYLSFLRQQSASKLQVKVNQLLSDLEELLKAHPSLGANNLFIRRMAEDLVVPVNGTDLIQIALNLTVNALQATSDPHRVEISCERPTVALETASLKDGPNDRYVGFQNLRGADHLILRIHDNGPGIGPEVLAKLFVPYFTTKGEGSGTGLGLCIVQRLVKQAQGAIHVHSELGVGTTFAIYIPAS